MPNYCETIFDNTTDGYIQLVKLNNKNAIKIYNTNYKMIRNIVEEVSGETDVFITPNTFYKPQRVVKNIRQYRSLFIDIDVEKHNRYDKTETIYNVEELVNKGEIPKPSMVIDSGRGIHLYWKIDNAPFGAIQTWQELEDFLYSKLTFLGADIKATDGARVLRLPNTINSKNNSICNIVYTNNLQYSMYDLREKYIHYKKKQKPAVIKNKQHIVNNMFTSYSLHLARANDIETLCRLRHYDMKGYRNFVLHTYAYWEGIYIREPEKLKERIFNLNRMFAEPLRNSEVEAILRCVPKAINKFIDYEQGLRSGFIKRVSRGMRDKGGYWYKNETLIDALKITAKEQTHMKTIIGLKEKYRRNNLKRTPRDENGLTKKQLEIIAIAKRVKELRETGCTIREIAKELGISKSKVDRLLK